MERNSLLALGEKRIVNILTTRWYASEKMLQAKICEFCAGNYMVDPMILSDALRVLVRKGQVQYERQRGTIFYWLTGKFDPVTNPRHKERRANVLGWYAEYKRLASDRSLCGAASELATRNAMIAAGITPMRLGANADFDFEADLSGGIHMVGEVKNYRNWFCGQDKEIWQFLMKAATLAVEQRSLVLPVFIARKIHATAYAMFARAGVLAHYINHQYFQAEVTPLIADIRHKDGLGFGDIRCNVDEPMPQFIKFFGTTVQQEAASKARAFQLAAPLIIERAGPMLTLHMGSRRRRELYKELYTALDEIANARTLLSKPVGQ